MPEGVATTLKHDAFYFLKSGLTLHPSVTELLHYICIKEPLQSALLDLFLNVCIQYTCFVFSASLDVPEDNEKYKKSSVHKYTLYTDHTNPK